jgi:hypothetical protein
MKTFLLVLRCGLEGIIGLYMMVVTPLAYLVAIIRGLFMPGARAYALGMLVGVSIFCYLGYLVFRDALRVGRRIRTKPQTNPN